MTRSVPLPRGGRICEPADTVRRLEPHWPLWGITRLARQTGLDRIGIPVWAAMRPNSRSLAVTQGKGADDASAMASALMEAVEYAIAERPEADTILASPNELRAAGEPLFEPSRAMPQGASLPPDEPIRWLPGRQLCRADPVWIPLEAVRLDHTQAVFGGMSRSSNGLASGNNEAEALLHAACELVERDATTLFSLRARGTISAAVLEPAALRSDPLDALAARITQAGFHLKLFGLTTDIAIPVVQALIWDATRPVVHQLDVAGGTGCHPFAAHAAVRAVTEAAQTRITNIAGARDDLDPAEYREPLRRDLPSLLAMPAPPSPRRAPADLAPAATTPDELLAAVTNRLRTAGLSELPFAVLGGAGQGLCVVKVFAPDLEDRPANQNWRPGPRATSAMLRLW